MSIIKKLPIHEAQKIAAGEVVERPYNVVKELVENALDAQAKHITLWLQDGGKHYIRCVDDGIGMDADDARMSIEHHATSKLNTIHDLATLTTFGFRGEALSSIAAVSDFTLLTQQKDSLQGTRITVKNATEIQQSTIARAPGTEIIIENLFATIPVRRTFLKSSETEFRATQLMVQAAALAHPHVGFTLYHDNVVSCSAPATPHLSERIAQLFDTRLTEHLLPLQQSASKHGDLSITGYISNYHYHRYDRSHLFFLVNNRWVKNYKLSNAVLQGYHHGLPAQRYPCAVINITIDPKLVDSNVHPRKEEVAFLHPRLVERAIEECVYATLQAHTTAQTAPLHHRPSLHLAQHTTQPLHHEPRETIPLNSVPPQYTAQGPVVQEFVQSRWAPQQRVEELKTPQQNSTTVQDATLQLPADTLPHAQPTPCTIIGQYAQTYLLTENAGALILIDQHAAHECILYQQFMHKPETRLQAPLLFPHLMECTAHDLQLIIQHNALLEEYGIIIEQASAHSIAITQIPLALSQQDISKNIHEILGWLAQERLSSSHELKKIIDHKLYAMMACKAAVKAGDVLTTTHMAELVNQLHMLGLQKDSAHTTRHGYNSTCPHGRPTTWRIGIEEIERAFKRRT